MKYRFILLFALMTACTTPATPEVSAKPCRLDYNPKDRSNPLLSSQPDQLVKRMSDLYQACFTEPLSESDRIGRENQLLDYLISFFRKPVKDKVALLDYLIQKEAFKQNADHIIRAFVVLADDKSSLGFLKKLKSSSKYVMAGRDLTLFLHERKTSHQKAVEKILRGDDFFVIEAMLFGLVYHEERSLNLVIQEIQCPKLIDVKLEPYACNQFDDMIRDLTVKPYPKKPCANFTEYPCDS